jgi:hypothetical protein
MRVALRARPAGFGAAIAAPRAARTRAAAEACGCATWTCGAQRAHGATSASPRAVAFPPKLATAAGRRANRLRVVPVAVDSTEVEEGGAERASDGKGAGGAGQRGDEGGEGGGFAAFANARAYARVLRLHSEQQWRERCVAGMPAAVPSRPNVVYAKSGCGVAPPPAPGTRARCDRAGAHVSPRF